ncbi:BamA/TamA family outer membrane protein [Flavobacterium suzhouense]|uniref:BamA/TamA family outer membrane protein n=1 Tax=Flavobacterium suzhouense TaxID=1529638 RepID=A0ABW5NVI4_9FLAO
MKNALFCFVLLISTVLSAQEKVNDSIKKKFDITGIPIVSYNDAYGSIVGLNSMAFFNLNKKDTISPASIAGLGGGFSENKTWFITLFSQLYLDEDKWRVTAGIGFGNINFQYYESSNEGEEGFVDYSNITEFAAFRVMRQIVPHFYGGGIIKFQHSKTHFETGIDSIANANGLGISFMYDTRDDVYYPEQGWKAAITYVANSEWLGSKESFHSIRAYSNYYWKINNRMVLANRASIFSGMGTVPFFGQHTVGGKDIRGYTEGKYRGNQVYSIQSEYRWNFYRRWGTVGFFGMAFTGNPSSGALPAGGAGIRFKAIPSQKINIGIDYAIGKKDSGIYFRIGESF